MSRSCRRDKRMRENANTNTEFYVPLLDLRVDFERIKDLPGTSPIA